MNSVGKGVIKKDAMALVTGQPVYCADNMRGSKEYREKLVEGLTQKLLRKVESYVG